MNPIRLTLAFLASFLASQSTAVFASTDLYQQTYPVPGLPCGNIPDELAEGKVATFDLKSFLSEKGVTFIEGSSAFYSPSAGVIVVSHVKESHLIIGDILENADTLTTIYSQARSWIAVTEGKSGVGMLEIAKRTGYLFNPIVHAYIQQLTSIESCQKSRAPDLEPLLRHQANSGR